MRRKKILIQAIDKKASWKQIVLYLLEAILGVLVILKISFTTTSQVEINGALLEINANLTKATAQLFEFNASQESDRQKYLKDVEHFLNLSSEKLIVFLGDKIPSCGYSQSGLPDNSQTAFVRMVAETHGPAGKLFDLGTEAYYPNGASCSPKIRKHGLIENLRKEASETYTFEVFIAIIGLFILLIKGIELLSDKRGSVNREWKSKKLDSF